MAFHPSRNILASGSADRKVILWDVDYQSWLKRACQIANRNLLPSEWQQYFGDESYRRTCADTP